MEKKYSHKAKNNIHTTYSASALEREKVTYHLEDQEIKLSPRKTQQPDVKHLVYEHPP